MVRVSKKGREQTLIVLSSPPLLGHAEVPDASCLRGDVAADLQDFAGTRAAAPTGPRGKGEGDARAGARQPPSKQQPEGPRHASSK